jgi:hypothetical protein
MQILFFKFRFKSFLDADEEEQKIVCLIYIK